MAQLNIKRLREQNCDFNERTRCSNKARSNLARLAATDALAAFVAAIERALAFASNVFGERGRGILLLLLTERSSLRLLEFTSNRNKQMNEKKLQIIYNVDYL